MEDEKTADQGRTSRPFLCVLCLISHYYANKIYWRIIERDSTRPLLAGGSSWFGGGGGALCGAAARPPCHSSGFILKQRSWIQPRFSSSVIRDRFSQSSTIKHHPVWENEAYRSSELDSQSDPDSQLPETGRKKITVCNRVHFS